MPPHLLPALIALFGCHSSDEVDEGVDTGTTATPSPYQYEPPESLDPVFDQAAMESALADFVSSARNFNADPVLAGYHAAMESADASCPTWVEYDGNAFWSGYCYTNAHTWFDGFAIFYTYEGDIYGDGTEWLGESAYGSATIRDPSDAEFHLGGVASSMVGQTAYGATAYVSNLSGGFTVNWEESSPTWLHDGTSPNLLLYAIDYEEYNGHALMIQGSLSGISESATAIDTESLLLLDAVFGWDCVIEPAGMMGIRDAKGTWWDVIFDVDGETGVATTGDCDGCGAVYQGGELIGELCADFTPLLEWEGTPW